MNYLDMKVLCMSAIFTTLRLPALDLGNTATSGLSYISLYFAYTISPNYSNCSMVRHRV